MKWNDALSPLDDPLFDKQDRVRNGWKILGFFTLTYVLGQLTFITGLWTWLGLEWCTSLVVLAASLVCLALEKEPLLNLRTWLSWRAGLEFALGSAGGILLMLLTAACIFAFHGFQWQLSGNVGLRELLAGVWLYLGVAVSEELLFRGYPFQRLLRGSGIPIALVLMALYFAYAHWDNPGMSGTTKVWATVNIFMAGLLLGVCYLRTRRLALPIGVHLGWNWAQGSLLGFGVSGTMDTGGWLRPIFQGRPEWLTGGTFGLEASLPCAIFCGLAILGLSLWRPKLEGNHEP